MLSGSKTTGPCVYASFSYAADNMESHQPYRCLAASQIFFFSLKLASQEEMRPLQMVSL